MNTIGNIIGLALKKKTVVEREEIAGHLGISRRTLDAVVKGTSNLTLEQITKLSDILSTDLFGQYFAKTGRNDLLILQDSAKPEYTTTNNVSLHFTLKARVESFGNFQNFLNELRKISAKYGYDIV